MKLMGNVDHDTMTAIQAHEAHHASQASIVNVTVEYKLREKKVMAEELDFKDLEAAENRFDL